MERQRERTYTGDGLPPDRAERARQLNARLREALDARFEDGTSIVSYILAADPGLAARLREALTRQ